MSYGRSAMSGPPRTQLPDQMGQAIRLPGERRPLVISGCEQADGIEQLFDAVRLLAIETDRRLDDVLDDALRLLLASVATSRPITFPTYGARTLLGD